MPVAVRSGMLRLAAVSAVMLAAVAVARENEPSSGPPVIPPTSNRLPKVLLIGDSICGGYEKDVKRLLERRAEVVKQPGNAEHTGTGLKKIDEWLGDGKWDVIHFNWGLWDIAHRSPTSKNRGNLDKLSGKLTTPLADYERNLRTLVARLKQTGATLRWASITPVPDGEPGRNRGDEVKYNAVAAKVMAESGVPIDDLHGLMLADLAKYQSAPGDVHFNGAGCSVLAKQVAQSIQGALDGLKPAAANGFAWPSAIPAACPFPPSPTLTGIYFTGKHSDYQCGDTFYPSWASDGNLYSPWTDGTTDGVNCGSGDKPKRGGSTGHAVMTGEDPLTLSIKNTSPPKEAWAKPYRGRYPCGSLVYNGIWYYGTYCLGAGGTVDHRGFKWNWPNLGPMPGFQISRDLGKTWEASPLSPQQPLFPEPAKYLGPVKMGAPHFVDFGKNMEHSPDGHAYLLGMGAEEDDPNPRPCIKPGQPGQPFEPNPGCTDDFDHANLSWISADQTYLARVKPSPDTINDLKAYEFFAGNDASGKPVWTSDYAKIKPLLEWNNHMGCVTATYVPGLGKYLMCVTDGWPTVAKMNSYILEADVITGPWRIVTYLKDFGEQAYFLNFPSKFISADGKSLWLCYSANFSPGWNGTELKFNPPGGRYGLCLHEVKLLGPGQGGSSAATPAPTPRQPTPPQP